MARGGRNLARNGADNGTDNGTDLMRRHRLMGAGAELFYEKPLHLVRGAGVWLYDAQGRRLPGRVQQCARTWGMRIPTVVAAIQRQTAILATHTRYLHDKDSGVRGAAHRRLPEHLDACIFVNSGSEANDVAWRMAKMATGHEGGLVMEHAYHGITDAVAALTPGAGRPRDPRVLTIAPPPAGLRVDDPMEPRDDGPGSTGRRSGHRRPRCPRLCAGGLFHRHGNHQQRNFRSAARLGGRRSATRVRAAGGLIVADEVQYGLGRSGSHFWGFERRGIEPDIVTLGKPVGNGYPMGVVVANRALIEAFQAKFGFFSTFGGNAVAAAAGLAVLEVLDDEELMANAVNVGTLPACATRVRRRPARVPGRSARHRPAAGPRGPRPRCCGIETRTASGSSTRWRRSIAF